jgi:hypothetical protein
MKMPYRKRFEDINVQQNQSTSVEFELDKNVVFVTGFYLSSEYDRLLFNRGTIRVEINGREYIPEGFEAKVMLCGNQTDPNTRFFLLDKVNGKVVPLSKKIKFTFKDNAHPEYPYQPYRVSLYVEGETEE